MDEKKLKRNKEPRTKVLNELQLQFFDSMYHRSNKSRRLNWKTMADVISLLDENGVSYCPEQIRDLYHGWVSLFSLDDDSMDRRAIAEKDISELDRQTDDCPIELQGNEIKVELPVDTNEKSDALNQATMGIDDMIINDPIKGHTN